MDQRHSVSADVQFIRWDDSLPGICLADYPTGDTCGVGDAALGVRMFARYLLDEGGGTALLLTGAIVRQVTSGGEALYDFREGSLLFDALDEANRVASGVISAKFESDVTIEGTFDIMD